MCVLLRRLTKSILAWLLSRRISQLGCKRKALTCSLATMAVVSPSAPTFSRVTRALPATDLQ